MPPRAKKMDPAKIRAMFKAFADLLDSWNSPRKACRSRRRLKASRRQSPAFIMKIIAALDKTVARTDPTSPAESLDWRDEWAGCLDSDDALAAKPGSRKGATHFGALRPLPLHAAGRAGDRGRRAEAD